MTVEQITVLDNLTSVLLDEMWQAFSNNLDKSRAERACNQFVKNIASILTPAPPVDKGSEIIHILADEFNFEEAKTSKLVAVRDRILSLFAAPAVKDLLPSPVQPELDALSPPDHIGGSNEMVPGETDEEKLERIPFVRSRNNTFEKIPEHIVDVNKMMPGETWEQEYERLNPEDKKPEWDHNFNVNFNLDAHRDWVCRVLAFANFHRSP